MLNRFQAALISLMASLIILWGLQPVQACVEGLAWGMPLDQVHAHLGAGPEPRALRRSRPDRGAGGPIRRDVARKPQDAVHRLPGPALAAAQAQRDDARVARDGVARRTR